MQITLWLTWNSIAFFQENVELFINFCRRTNVGRVNVLIFIIKK